jgi:hypothetical protein
MTRYAIESFGFNDGHPYEEFTTDDLEQVNEQFDIICTDQPRVGHRVIEILQERDAVGR